MGSPKGEKSFKNLIQNRCNFHFYSLIFLRPVGSKRHRLQPVPQTPLTTSSSVTTRDSLSELDSPLAAPSVGPLQGRGLNKNRGNRRFLRLFSIAGHAMFFLSAGAWWGVWGKPHGLDRSGLQWCDADDRRCGLV